MVAAAKVMPRLYIARIYRYAKNSLPEFTYFSTDYLSLRIMGFKDG